MMSDDVSCICRGDYIFLETKSKGETGHVDRVVSVTDTHDMSDNYLKVETEGLDKPRYVTKSSIDDVLVARYEDINSPSVLELRCKEAMLSSQITLIEGEGSSFLLERMKAKKELERVLFAVRKRLKEKGARISHDSSGEI